MRALVGTTGWSHPDWVGPFYPVHLRARPDDWLAHYATHFRTVEISSSFDRFPDGDLVQAWARAGVELHQRAPFEFSLKLPRAFTHEALPAGDVAVARELAGTFDREVLDPLEGEGLLGAVLVQLPPSMDVSPDRVDALIEGLAPLAERRIAVELRNATWVKDGCVVPELERLFLGRDTALVEADMPGAEDIRAPIAARHAYLRFHGRRAHGWGAGDARDGSRYDHLYAPDELAPWAERVAAHQRAGREVRCYFNNAPRAQAVANAQDLARLIGTGGASPRARLTAQKRLPL